MNGPLTGVKVLDLTRFIAGPHCGMILGDLGADVVKIEKPGVGEETRVLPPHVGGESLFTMIFNRNKQGMTLDFRNPRGQEILRDLAVGADVILENFRPGVMEKMGCGWQTLHEINPRLIMVRISGFGQDGPYAQRPCFDIIAQSMSGLADLTGQADGPPTMIGTFAVDYTAGLYAVIGTQAALRARDGTGRGQLVDISLLDSAISLLLTAIPEQSLLGNTRTRAGNRDKYMAPSNVFQTGDDRWVFIVAGSDNHFSRFVEEANLTHVLDDPDLATGKARKNNISKAEAVVADWVRQRTAAHVVDAMEHAGVPCAKIATIDEVVDNPQLRHRGQIVEVEHPNAGTVPMQGMVVKLSDTPGEIRLPPPSISEHTEQILNEWLGMNDSDVAQLRDDGVV